MRSRNWINYGTYGFLDMPMKKANIKQKANEQIDTDDIPELDSECTSKILCQKFNMCHTFSNWGLLQAIVQTLFLKFVCISFLNISVILIMAVEPLIIERLLALLESRSECEPGGLKEGCIIGLLEFSKQMLFNFLHRLNFTSMALVTSILSAAILQKSMRISCDTLNKGGQGQILFLLGKCQAMSRFVTFFQQVLVFPIKVITVLWSLTRVAGMYSALILFLCVVSIGLNFVINKKCKKCQQENAELGKTTSHLCSECISGIKTIKVNVLESYSQSKILEKFDQEKLAEIRGSLWNQVNNSQKETMIQIMIISVLLLVTWSNEALTASQAYFIFALYNQVRSPLFSLAEVIGMYTEVTINASLINSFLQSDERKVKQKREETKKGQIIMENVTAVCHEPKKSTIALKNVEMVINPGELVAVVGPVGSGKSLLAKSIINETKLTTGNISTSGKIAYLPQEPWIFTDTLRSNILMQHEFDQARYFNVLRCVDLIKDLEMLPKGDNTIIGSKGINLSGGQRQRIALARALYSQSDIYIFDDSFSQLDLDLEKKLMKTILFSTLQDKTRVFITTKAKFLYGFPKIFIMNKGNIVKEGNYLAVNSCDLFKSLYDKSESLPQISDTETIQNPSKSTAIVSNGKVEGKQMASINIREILSYFVFDNFIITLLFLFLIGFELLTEHLRNKWLYLWSQQYFKLSYSNYIMMYVLIIIGNIMGVFLKILAQKAGERKILQKLNQSSTMKIFEAPLSWYCVTPSGSIVKSINGNYSDSLMVVSGSTQILMNIGTFFGIVYSIYRDVPEIIVYLFLVFYFSKFLRNHSSALVTGCIMLEEKQKEFLATGFQELFDGIYSLRLTSSLRRWIKTKIYKILDDLARVNITRRMAIVWIDQRLKLITSFIYWIIIAFCLTSERCLSPASVGFILQYLSKAYWMIEGSFYSWEDLYSNLIKFSRVRNFISTIPSESYGDKNSTISVPNCPTIHVHNLNLDYDGSSVITGANFCINPRDKVCVIGRSGEGKSTLLLSLIRVLCPSSSLSQICLNSTNLNMIPLKFLRRKLVMVPQESWMFSGSLHSNIDPSGRYPPDELTTLLNKLGLLDLLSKRLSTLDNLLDLQIGDNGNNISQGEKQIIALARAIIQQPAVLLLDEATANLDDRIERTAYEVMFTLLPNTTFIMISHRLQALKYCNRVFKVESGSVCEVSSEQ